MTNLHMERQRCEVNIHVFLNEALSGMGNQCIGGRGSIKILMFPKKYVASLILHFTSYSTKL